MTVPDDGCGFPLVFHLDGYVACLDDDCVAVHELHVLELDCRDLEPHGCEGGD